MDRENPLDPHSVGHFPNGEGFRTLPALPADDHAFVDLHALLLALHDPHVDSHRITDFKARYAFLDHRRIQPLEPIHDCLSSLSCSPVRRCLRARTRSTLAAPLASTPPAPRDRAACSRYSKGTAPDATTGLLHDRRTEAPRVPPTLCRPADGYSGDNPATTPRKSPPPRTAGPPTPPAPDGPPRPRRSALPVRLQSRCNRRRTPLPAPSPPAPARRCLRSVRTETPRAAFPQRIPPPWFG